MDSEDEMSDEVEVIADSTATLSLAKKQTSHHSSSIGQTSHQGSSNCQTPHTQAPHQGQSHGSCLEDSGHGGADDFDEPPGLSHAGHGGMFNITRELDESMNVEVDEQESSQGLASEDLRCMLMTATGQYLSHIRLFTCLK